MKSEIDFVKGHTNQALIKMVVPLLLAMILMMAYNLVDSLWVGNLLGEEAYAALTNSTAIVMILSAIAMGSSNGVAILVSQAIGAGKKKEADSIIATILMMSAVFSIVVTVLIEVFLKQILIAMHTPSEILNMAYDYLYVYMIGYAVIFIYMHFTAIFRSFGDPVFQMKGMFISTIFNAVLNPIMIHFIGLSGSAWATVLSEVICLLFAVYYHKKRKLFELKLSNISFKYNIPLLKDAVPSALQGCMPAISSAMMIFLVSRFGVTTIAAYGVTSRLEILLFYPAMAMSMALTTIIGQCIGANRRDRAKAYVKSSLILGGAFLAVISVLVIVFAGQLSGIFIHSSEASKIVKGYFQIVSIGYVLYMITSCFLGELNGMGKPTMSMVLMFIYYIVIRIPLAAVLVRSTLGMNGIWIAILVSHVLSAGIAVIFSVRARKNAAKDVCSIAC